MKTAAISSPANPLVKDVRRAITQGHLTSEGLLVAETFHLLDEAIRSKLEIPVVLAAERAQRAAERALRPQPVVRLFVLPDSLFNQLPGTESAQGVIALVRPPAWKFQDLLDTQTMIVVLDGVQDPGNAGSILRAAEAFGASGAIFVSGTVSPFNAKVIRASAGSLFRMPFQFGEDGESVKAGLSCAGLRAYAASAHHGSPINTSDLSIPMYVVVGSEARGVGPVLASGAVPLYIPTTVVESLNAAQAAAVILYEASRQRSSAETVKRNRDKPGWEIAGQRVRGGSQRDLAPDRHQREKRGDRRIRNRPGRS